jgi:hypothetical protein
MTNPGEYFMSSTNPVLEIISKRFFYFAALHGMAENTCGHANNCWGL